MMWRADCKVLIHDGEHAWCWRADCEILIHDVEARVNLYSHLPDNTMRNQRYIRVKKNYFDSNMIQKGLSPGSLKLFLYKNYTRNVDGPLFC